MKTCRYYSIVMAAPVLVFLLPLGFSAWNPSYFRPLLSLAGLLCLVPIFFINLSMMAPLHVLATRADTYLAVKILLVIAVIVMAFICLASYFLVPAALLFATQPQ